MTMLQHYNNLDTRKLAASLLSLIIMSAVVFFFEGQEMPEIDSKMI